MNEQLQRLSDRYWDRLMAAAPTWAALIGDHRFDAEVEDLSEEAEADLAAELHSIVADTEAIDSSTLDPADQVTRRVLMFEAESQAGSLDSRSAEYLVDPMLGIHIDMIQGIPQLRATTTEQAGAYVTKASKTGLVFAQALDRHRRGVENGRTPPRISAEKVLAQLDAYVASPIETDPFLQIGTPDDWSEIEEARWRRDMSEQISTVIRPAAAAYRAGIAADVLPHTRPQERSGICWLPDGDEVYERAVRRYTSLDLTPEEIHRIGLDAIASLEEKYRTLGAKVLGTDDVPEIYRRLRADPALRFETAEQVQQAAEGALARANAAIPKWFGRLPVAPCVVQPIPDVGAADTTIAYYFPPADDGSRPGIFFINLTEPTTRTRFESEALAFHESVPGHHLQLAIAQELDDVPSFRRHGMATAYIEGWGLYAERLSDEMGLYSNDLARLGILSFDSWRACRLVVDTGLHSMGWSRQQAIDYMMENSPQAPNNIVNEVDRYIGYSAQALAYKLGQREILRLRDRAKATMGTRFDIKGFHDAVLEPGPVPLDVLGDLIEDWATA
ncbi:MAG TPA: DUF885 domain-containing protein [Acidimicrobiia bacterium]|nr:DUF885 domain-containing protein [Acidimicrobiia bacterium]